MDRNTLEQIPKFLELIDRYSPEVTERMLVGTHCEFDNHAVTFDEAKVLTTSML
jgi:hypothetical protein